MGADAFLVFYGIKVSLDSEDESLWEAIESETDPRILAAQRAGLDTWVGRMTDGEDEFLYIGRNLGSLGDEGSSYLQIGMEELSALSLRVAAKLREAGLEGDPVLHLQLEAQY
jgi:hypothetical protein